MAVFKCKMCGGALDVSEGQSVVECEYCGTHQTLPRLDDEHKINLYDRANHFRRCNEFDKATSIYEQILTEDNTDAESYWSLVLCRYGIEYVEDPLTHKRIPTVNRAQFTSIYSDENYLAALRYADESQKAIYESEAQAIEDIQKGILEISSKEEPFDVFICYKESDERGGRTQDSVLAQEIYYQLTEKGYKVFFSRITLESKIGQQYEPYIFAALNSAKVMVIVGTKPEYFNAVWVRNEWSRYLKIAQKDKGRLIIPAYKGMDPYDLPESLSYYQAQDMSKIGFIQDLIRGIDKVLSDGRNKAAGAGSEDTSKELVSSIAAMLKRGYMSLEDQEWDIAYRFFDQVLNADAECSEAYLGQALAGEKASSVDEYVEQRLKDTEPYEEVQHMVLDDEELRDEIADRLKAAELSESDVRQRFYKCCYSTAAECRREQYEIIKKRVETNKMMKRAISFAPGQRLELQDRIYERMEERIREAEEKDAKAREAAKEQFLEMLSKTIEAMGVEKRYRYEKAVHIYENGEYMRNAGSILGIAKEGVTLEELLSRFEKLGDYMDAPAYCYRITEQITREKQQLRVLMDRKNEIMNRFEKAKRSEYIRLKQELEQINDMLSRLGR